VHIVGKIWNDQQRHNDQKIVRVERFDKQKIIRVGIKVKRFMQKIVTNSIGNKRSIREEEISIELSHRAVSYQKIKWNFKVVKRVNWTKIQNHCFINRFKLAFQRSIHCEIKLTRIGCLNAKKLKRKSL